MIVVILAHNQSKFNSEMGKSILKAKDSLEGVRIIWVDNASDDEITTCLLKAMCNDNKWEYRRNEENKPFTIAVKEVINDNQGEDIYLINNDVVVYDGWLHSKELLKDYGMIGACQVFPEEPQFITFAGGGKDFASHIVMWDWQKWNGIKEADWLTFGACMINRKAYDSIGGLDERFLFYCSDSDLSLRMKYAGYKIGVDADMTIGHWGGMTTKSVQNEMSQHGREDQIAFAETHGLKAFGIDFRSFNINDRREWFQEYYNSDKMRARSEFISKRKAEHLYKKLDLKGKRVLELGSGMGFVVKSLKEKGVDITGCDLIGSENVMEIDLITDLDKLDSLGKFDIIFSTALLEHLPPSTIEKILDKQGRLLNKGGTFYHEIDTQIGVDKTHINIQTPLSWDNLFDLHGFTIDSRDYQKSGMYSIKGGLK